MNARFAIPLVLLAAAGAVPAAAETGLWSAGSATLRAAGGEFRFTASGVEHRVVLPESVRVEELIALHGGAFLSALAPAASSGSSPSPRADLFLALLDERGAHPLPNPAPARDEDGARENAVPLTSGSGELAGLVWLEGRDRQSYAVRHAAWDGLRWSEPETLAEPAAGSQLALAAATLGDGSQLLLWSRFDGHDDEIVAARFVDGTWGPPQAIAPDNPVPDVTPSVVAVPGGALAAWSRYDGHDYRVVIARFDGREWSEPAWVGPPGSTAPRLIPRPERVSAGRAGGESTAAWLTYANALPRGWEVTELDGAGSARRRGRAVDVPFSRPAVEATAEGAVRLRWAGGESTIDLR